jgi:hypothetical protein
MNAAFFLKLLEQFNEDEMAQHSIKDHHVYGMDYLCLARTPGLTVKIYHMNEPYNPNEGFLVHPHSHRYAFDTIVLRGFTRHLRFKPMAGEDWRVHSYNPDTKAMLPTVRCGWECKVESHGAGSTYSVHEDEIHTLQVEENNGPLLLGLFQYRDTRKTTSVLTPVETEYLNQPGSRKMNIFEASGLAHRAIELIKETL